MATRIRKSKPANGVVPRRTLRTIRASTMTEFINRTGVGVEVGIGTSRASVAGNCVEATRIASSSGPYSPLNGSSGAGSSDGQGMFMCRHRGKLCLDLMMVGGTQIPDNVPFALEGHGDHAYATNSGFQISESLQLAKVDHEPSGCLEVDRKERFGRLPNSKRTSDSTPDMIPPKKPRSDLNQHTSHCGGRDEQEGNCSDSTRKPVDPDRDDASQGLSFACPYYRWDPVAHQSCLNYRLNRIRDVKQHLQRRHYSRHFYCPTCLETFLTLSCRDVHIRSRECTTSASLQKPENIDGVSQTARDRLKERVNRAVKPAEQWFAVWDILFGDAVDRQAVDPYIGSMVRETLRMVRVFWDSHAPKILPKFLESQPKKIEDPGHLQDILNKLFHKVGTEFEGSLNLPTTTGVCPSPTAVEGSSEPVVREIEADYSTSSASSSGTHLPYLGPQWDLGDPEEFHSQMIDSNSTMLAPSLVGTPPSSEYREEGPGVDQDTSSMSLYFRGMGSCGITGVPSLSPTYSFCDTSLPQFVQQQAVHYHHNFEFGQGSEQVDVEGRSLDWIGVRHRSGEWH